MEKNLLGLLHWKCISIYLFPYLKYYFMIILNHSFQIHEKNNILAHFKKATLVHRIQVFVCTIIRQKIPLALLHNISLPKVFKKFHQWKHFWASAIFPKNVLTPVWVRGQWVAQSPLPGAQRCRPRSPSHPAQAGAAAPPVTMATGSTLTWSHYNVVITMI